MFHYIKFILFHLTVLPAIIGFTLGGSWLSLGIFSMIIFIVSGDLLLGEDTTTPNYRHKWLLNLQLYAALPLIFLVLFVFLWTVTDGDPLGYGAWIQSTFGYDALAARETNDIGGYVGAIFSAGLFIAVVGTNIGHELTHRTWDPLALIVGRWLLSFSFDAGFSIEHVYGHHVRLGSKKDPATAPRGRSVYRHIVMSTYLGNISAYNIEKNRLEKSNLPVISIHNRYLRGWLMTAAILVLSYVIAGVAGVVMFTFAGLWGKSILEIVNYMEHYGIVRNIEVPVEPKHSWNSNKKISSWALFNLPRHSHHHAKGDVPFWDLKPYEGAPMMINGYLTTVLIALIPPLWHHFMTPKLIEWDEKYANDEERIMAARANRESGLADLQDNGYLKAMGVPV